MATMQAGDSRRQVEERKTKMLESNLAAGMVPSIRPSALAAPDYEHPTIGGFGDSMVNMDTMPSGSGRLRPGLSIVCQIRAESIARDHWFPLSLPARHGLHAQRPRLLLPDTLPSFGVQACAQATETLC
eukprot:351140-Chlamydomonas_euryale.AAC.36